ncbi:Predicted dehydrogenase [Lentzea albidocapillata subsp. violacea]|uniref:Predicted dehydrogenase n=1 Tax=Lentzea albidocapillata subsp. violacea TaxID=128104 RepID=A0A1G8WF12_9PSEU|nr:Gfo/Idh/MocA family oxidoreductase [Lentzea albidocapillata]SDJ76687.1 Predicted dehydrogenase [Lentzea albidocapillata subsp. violacea]
MTDHVRIGVLGAAMITPAAVIRPARSSTVAEVVAVAARSTGKAKAFADKHGIARVHDSYEDLLADPAVNAVYNPLPNGLHGKWTLAALEAGKHVLCEKPFTANADEAASVARAADASGLVVMEAFHYRYHPLALRVAEIMRSGVLGPLRHVEASVCFPLPMFSNIRYDYSLAGGAMMDAGCYAVHMARLLGGEEPEVRSAKALLRGPSIDRAMRASLRFPSGHTGSVHASLWSSTVFKLSMKAIGENGTLTVLNPLGPQTVHRLSLKLKDKRSSETFGKRATYDYQLDAFTDAVLHGKPFPTTADDAVKNMTVIDSIYRAAGLPVRRPTP